MYTLKQLRKAFDAGQNNCDILSDDYLCNESNIAFANFLKTLSICPVCAGKGCSTCR